MESDDFARDWTRGPFYRSPAVTKQKSHASNDNRFPDHAINAANELPDRRPTQVVSSFHIRDASVKRISLCCSQSPVVMKPLLGKRANSPSLHPRRGDCNPIQTTGGIWNISTNLLKARSPAQLAHTS